MYLDCTDIDLNELFSPKSRMNIERTAAETLKDDPNFNIDDIFNTPQVCIARLKRKQKESPPSLIFFFFSFPFLLV